MARAEDPNPSSKKRKKTTKKKDKWGQPLPSSPSDDPHPSSDDFSSSSSPYERTKVVVSGMPYSATEDDIRALFNSDAVSQLQLATFPDSCNFSGLAFLTFKSEEAALKSLELDGTNMGNRFIKVERCRLDPQRKRKSEFPEDPKKEEGCSSAYIGNLSWEVTEEDIRNLLDESKISSIRLATNKITGKFRGFGHIEFEDDESLEQAILKNQVKLHGRPVKIAYAVANKH